MSLIFFKKKSYGKILSVFLRRGKKFKHLKSSMTIFLEKWCQNVTGDKT